MSNEIDQEVEELAEIIWRSKYESLTQESAKTLKEKWDIIADMSCKEHFPNAPDFSIARLYRDAAKGVLLAGYKKVNNA